MSSGHDYLREIVGSDALVPCLTEVLLASQKEKVTEVISKVTLRIKNPLPNEEGIYPNHRFCFANTSPIIEFKEVLSFDKKGGILWGRGAFNCSSPGH